MNHRQFQPQHGPTASALIAQADAERAALTRPTDPDIIDLAVVERPGVLMPLYDVQTAMQGMAQLHALVNTYLVASKPGSTDGDYGIIPGTKKPTLLKSGADKLCDIYGLLDVYDILTREVDWGRGIIAYEVQCRLLRKGTDTQVGAGLGSCSTQETKYRYVTEWWNGTGDPPTGEGWERTKSGKWQKKGEHPNPADLQNTVLKMAKKRAKIDAVLSVTRSSGLFTQDLEDYVTPETTPATPAQQDRILTGMDKLGWDDLRQVAYLIGTLTQAGADAILTDLRARYRETQKAAAPAQTPTGEPVNATTGEIAGTYIDVPAVTASTPTAPADPPAADAPADPAAAAEWDAMTAAADAARHAPMATRDQATMINDLFKQLRWTKDGRAGYLEKYAHVTRLSELTEAQAADMIADLSGRAAA